jgi:threonine dehydrogenase-like Zn-dependent dehydrogenase
MQEAMKTKAVRIYGKNDLRLEEFDLPAMKEDEILARVVSDSLCMSSYKATKQGAEHRRIPKDIHIHPTIIGHEFAGEIVEVGKKWRKQFRPGDRFAIQPALNYKGSLDAPGYSFRYIGGDATYVLIPNEVMEMNCLLPFHGDSFFLASLAEPMSCIIGAFRASYHTTYGTYAHTIGIKEDGSMALLAAGGPMGLGAIDYALHTTRKKPSLLVVTDIDNQRLQRASSIYTLEAAAKKGIRLVYLNTRSPRDPLTTLRDLTGGKGFDDVFVFAPVRQVIEQADRILGFDGCLNFFAGPDDLELKAEINFYQVHYAFTHLTATTGGNAEDMREAIDLMGKNILNPAAMVTHIGGLDSVIETTKNLPGIPGGKKLIYTHLSLPLVAIDDLASASNRDPMFSRLDAIVKKHGGVWSAEAEQFLLIHAPKI